MTQTNNTTIDNFIIEMTLIAPIEKIINQLNNGEFRDCDIKWLDKKLGNFMLFACETFGMKNMTVPASEYSILNPYTVGKYKEWFGGLLEYFKSFK